MRTLVIPLVINTPLVFPAKPTPPSRFLRKNQGYNTRGLFFIAAGYLRFYRIPYNSRHYRRVTNALPTPLPSSECAVSDPCSIIGWHSVTNHRRHTGLVRGKVFLRCSAFFGSGYSAPVGPPCSSICSSLRFLLLSYLVLWSFERYKRFTMEEAASAAHHEFTTVLSSHVVIGAVATLTLVLRFTARRRGGSLYGWDDWLCLVAGLCMWGDFVMTILGESVPSID